VILAKQVRRAKMAWAWERSEDAYKGFGRLSACANLRRLFSIARQEIGVLGAVGNTAVEEALFLTQFRRQRSTLDPSPRDTVRAKDPGKTVSFKTPRSRTLWFHALEEVVGEDNPQRRGPGVLRVACRGQGADHR